MRRLILGIETSCDETGLALVEAAGGLKSPRFRVLKSLVTSQVKVHEPFGGVVPNLAKREHLKNLPILFKKCRMSGIKYQDIDLIAVTVGPGLEPALWTGIGFAKQLYGQQLTTSDKKIQLVGTNHLEGHLYSFLLPRTRDKRQETRDKLIFPAIALIVSGGHTILLLVKDLKTWKKLGETRDDAVGEAYDKVARLLRLPYPGGPEIEKLAKKGNPHAIEFPRPMLTPPAGGKNYDFSFSGLKTSVLYFLRDHKIYENTKTCESTKKNMKGSETRFRNFAEFRTFVNKADVAASFQAAALEVLTKKTLRAAREFSAKSVMLSGGVAANEKLRRDMRQETSKIGLNFLVAGQKYNTDNAVMIAAAGYMTYLRGKKYPLRANGNLEI